MLKECLGGSCVALIAILSACGGTSEGTGGTGSGSVPISELPPKVAASYCALYTRCFGPLFGAFLEGEDCATLAQRQFEDTGLSKLQDAVDQKRVTYNADKVPACLDSIANRACADFTKRTDPTCQAAVSGTVDAAGDCEINAECKTGLYCKVGTACPGKCTALVKAGNACKEDDDCADGLVCSPGTQLCVQPQSDGQQCGGGVEPPCQPYLICLGDKPESSQPGTCKNSSELFVGKKGDSCNLQSGPFCQDGLSCAAQSTTSQSCVEHVAAGAPCQIALPDECPAGQYCKLPVQSLSGTCTAIPKAGETCATRAFGRGCEPYSRCDDQGICRSIQRLGGSCATDALCYSSNCSSGGCRLPSDCQ